MNSAPTLPSDGLRRIRRLAHSVRALSVAGAVTVLSLALLFWTHPERVARHATGDWGLKAVQLDPASLAGGFAASMLPGGVALWALWQLWSLFGCYAHGELLTPRPAAYLRRLGLALIALAAAMPLGHTLTVLALTWGNPPGQRVFWFGLSSQHYLSLMFGLMLLALATVLAEAARVARENAEFV
ncbi:DUF2975 domain-containing protein [Roseateles sp. DAIF2]|uniref:DUF2975 domain-containing protein n=1 Tax=Roseateles sp. DAIF2 TaxID=2714952 RepID=UPI0018A3199A|nr:DUF2975 domain-containing protein [Roseateles sp. DAIF2]QPF72953.1 DUF2975 domain-containing protein [Roseateles sp. DAIF2]